MNFVNIQYIDTPAPPAPDAPASSNPAITSSSQTNDRFTSAINASPTVTSDTAKNTIY